MSTADHHEPAHSPQGTGATMGPETQMLNLKILQNLAQNNIYRDEESKAGIRALEKSLLGQGRRYTPVEAAECAGLPFETAQRIWHNMGFPTIPNTRPTSLKQTCRCSPTCRSWMQKATSAWNMWHPSCAPKVN